MSLARLAVVVSCVVALAVMALPPAADALTASRGAVQQEPQEPAADHAEEQDHAAEQEHAAEEEHGASDEAWWPAWLEMPARWINFVLLVGLLYWVLVKPPAAIQDLFTYPGLGVILTERAKDILSARDLAARQKAEAARLLTESEERLAKIESEIAGLVDEARNSSVTDRERVVAEGEAQAGRILEVAGREVENERIAAQRQLRGFVADLAVNLARRNLEEHLTADDQARLINDYLARLGKSLA